MRITLSFLCLFIIAIQSSWGRTNAGDTLVPGNNPSADERAQKLLTSDPIYMENWINNVTFTYDNVRSTDLPEITPIVIQQPGEKFTPTWYGKLASSYKWRWGRQHHGVDLGLTTGEPIYAAWDGVVRYAQWNKTGYGNCVVIRHKNGLETLYGHMSKLLVSPNQYVTSGEIIGLGGSTGRSTGPHLHFEIRYKDFSINPELIVDYSTRKLRLDTFLFVRANISGTRYSGDINATPGSTETKESVSNKIHQPDSSKAPIEKKSVADSAMKATAETAPMIEEKKKPTPATRITKTESKKKETGKKETTKTKTTKKTPATYTIKKGDTYTSISRKTGVSIATLQKLNPRQKESQLIPGKTIRIR